MCEVLNRYFYNSEEHKNIKPFQIKELYKALFNAQNSDSTGNLYWRY